MNQKHLLFACWVIFHAFVVVYVLFLNELFKKILFRNTIRLSKGSDYQPMTKATASKERVSYL